MAKRILVVDDEPKVVTVIQRRLESAGYEVLAAYDGNEALSKARSENPDLIILDLILPKLNGYQVCAILKRDKSYKPIPILILTARSQEEDIEEGMRVGADEYLTKPFKNEVLLAKIEELLSKVEANKAKLLKEKIEKEKEIGEKLLKEAERMGVMRKEKKLK
ncbi:MAG: response regulator transcription factor [bacterium]|nr:response regulator [candidate division WOR-3 bacterium]MDH5683661.1 response regulator [candidate division WOR-3 bacterium]